MRTLKRRLVKIVGLVLSVIETGILQFIPAKSIPTIWIIGPPRSGTTLLYQVLVKRYKVAYISNFAVLFYKAPIFATWVANLLFSRQEAVKKFKSNYGKTTNWLGPHEAGPFWYRWFPRGDYVYVPPGSISQDELNSFKKEIIGLAHLEKAPVVFKNVYNSMRIAPIIETFPNACFLVCRRDPLDTAQSILNGRVKLYDDKSKWMGVPPKEIDAIKNHPYWQQVAEQVYFTYQQIETDKQNYGSDRFFEVDYEQLCKNPHQLLQQLEVFFALNNIRLKKIGDLPISFPFSTGKQVDDENYQLIQQAIEKLWQ